MTPAERQRRQVRTPVLAVSAAAWLGLAAIGHRHAGGHSEMTVIDPLTLAELALMVVAMMGPMTIGLLREVVERGVPARRWRDVANVLAGYSAAWVGVSVELALVAALVRTTVSPGVAALVGLAAAVVWQCTPAKQRCLNRTHAHRPVAGIGWVADRDARRLGVDHACWCIGSCWALMLAALLVAPGQQLAVMAVASVWLWAERLDRPTRPTWRPRLPVKAVRLAVAQLQLRVVSRSSSA